MSKEKLAFFWHRRDLRLQDNAGLYHALKGPEPVLPLFIFDQHILDNLEDKKDARVQFIHDYVNQLAGQLKEQGSAILVKYGKPEEVWPEILSEYEVTSVYTNRDYEPYALERDAKISELLAKKNISFHYFKDHVIFEYDEVLKGDGNPYVVFTPYSRKWREKLLSQSPRYGVGDQTVSYFLQACPNEKYFRNFWQTPALPIPSLTEMGFEETSLPIPESNIGQGLIRNYDETRDIPAIRGTSRLGIHFRFGTISIREKARKAFHLNDTFLSELIWRDFYAQILGHFPRVATASFRPEYDTISWRNNEADFEKWCAGQTGYPMVDAGMRELNKTGFMHNRVRMITASFLTKHLLIHWRWGEAYFAKKLLDFDLASNNGGWQWAAGSGTDAAPYFRVFNPTTQLKKFDKELKYVKQWVPEYGTPKYPSPMVDHKMARERCLTVYKEGLDRARNKNG